MKKILFLFVASIALMSCNSQDEILDQENKEIIMDNSSDQQYESAGKVGGIAGKVGGK